MWTSYAAPIVLVLLSCITGCNWSDGLRSAASVEHACPREQIVVLAEDGNDMARTVHLEVCGHERVYRDMGGSRAVVWVDVTPTSGGESPPEQPQAPQVVETVEVAPAELPAFIRSRIDAAAARILACIGADAGAIEATWTDAGTVALTLRGEEDPAVNDCVVAAIGSIVVPPGAVPGQLLHAVSR